MAELANYFYLQSGIEIHLVLFGRSREIFYSIPKNITIHIPHFKFNNNLKLWNTIKTIFFLRRTIHLIQPNSILSFGEYWNSFVLLALYGLKYPVFISDRCQPDKSFGVFHDRLRRWLYPGAQGIITQTSQAEAIYRIQFRSSTINTIGNPIHFVDTKSVIKKENIVIKNSKSIICITLSSKFYSKIINFFIYIILNY